MKSSVLVPGKGRAGVSRRRGHRTRVLSACPSLAPQVGKPESYLGSALVELWRWGRWWAGLRAFGGQGAAEEWLCIVSRSGRENESWAEMSGMREFVGLLQILSSRYCGRFDRDLTRALLLTTRPSTGHGRTTFRTENPFALLCGHFCHSSLSSREPHEVHEFPLWTSAKLGLQIPFHEERHEHASQRH